MTEAPVAARRLTPVELDMLGFIERKFLEKAKPPTALDLYRVYGDSLASVEDVEKLLVEPLFFRALMNRNLHTYIHVETVTPTQQKREGLSALQINAITMILDFNDKRSISDKLRSLKIRTTTWANWNRDPEFNAYFKKLINQNPESYTVNLQEALFRAAERGSVDAIKLGYELTGNPIGKGQSEQAQNLELMIRRLVESVQRHVKDPILLAAIAKDFEFIKEGKLPPILVENNVEVYAATDVAIRNQLEA